MEDYIEVALALGHIRPSTSPAAAGFFFVEKKDGGLRTCIDYRGLNAITIRYPYPLPLVPAALEQLLGAWVFTKLDLRSAYNLVHIREDDEWKTAFHTTHGHYEYCVMPFGLTNAPAVFQALINGVFRDLLGRGVIAYIDDILVYSTSMEDHVRQVREVLARLQRFHLFVKLEKCEFSWTTVTFLGYVISPRGVEMDTSKVWAVSDWPTPATIKELQRFLGFANFYRRFIQSYSSVAAPLTSLLRGKPKKLSWTDQARVAFQRFKDCFTTAPILCHPDRLFVVEVDASSSGLGAVLSQRHGDPEKVHPCAFYSRKLMTAEVNYDVGNRELLAIKAALEEWCHWLEGACHPFQVLTDHRNLEYLCLNPRQARWALFFTRFQFTVSYRPGSKNGKVDALSRQSEGPPLYWHRSGGTSWARFGRPTPRNRLPLTVPHADSLSCRSSGLRHGLIVSVPRDYWSPFRFHGTPGRTSPWISSWTYQTRGGSTAIMVVVDSFSKGCKLVRLKGLPTAMQTADAMFAHVFRNFGLPEDIVSDRGPQFTSLVWRALCARLDIGVSLSSSHHRQSNGQVERLNQEIGHFLRSYCSREQQRWSEFLPWAEYAQNSLTHSSTGLMPFQCVQGYQPPLFPWSGEPSSVPAVEEWYRRSQEVWEQAHVRLQRALPCRKLSPKFIGPFEIVRQVNPVAYRLRLPASYRICPTFHASLLKPVHASAGESVVGGDPPPPLDVEDLEKAYDRLPREELWYCMRKSGVAEKYVRVVQDMYERSRTVVRCAVGQTEEFKVEVGLHQGSALSPFLFAIVMDQLSEEVRQESPWTMMFADDIVICSESREQVEENLERWRFALERRGMKVSCSKTEYMCVNEREGSGTVRLQGEEVKKVQEFKYLGSTVQSNGECGKEVKKRVQAGWNGWRKVWGVLCDRKISARIKGKVYRIVVRPAMLYGLETVSLRKRQESELEVAELKMLRFSLGVTRLDRIRNKYIRGTAHVGRLGDKVRETRLRWFGHVQRRESEYIGRRMLDMELPGRRQRGRPKRRPVYGSNSIIKFADDTTVIGLISDNDETSYRAEVQHLVAWCADNNLLLNTSKTKELIIDFRREKGRTYDPIHINGMAVERVSSFKFLETHISEDLSWTTNTSSLVKKAHQCLCYLNKLKKNHLSSTILLNYYHSILTNCITADLGGVTVHLGLVGHRLVVEVVVVNVMQLPLSVVKE
ncbi:hypothetical protein QTP86_002145, partial [Hemibagrus guttatus]